MSNIYVASSWRNEQQADVVRAIRAVGHAVYDFKNPAPGNNGFGWRQIEPNWEAWTPERFRELLGHPVARAGFEMDMRALRQADATVLVLPCGRSAHLELGYAVAAGQLTIVLLAAGEPELMYRMCDRLCTSLDEVLDTLEAQLSLRKVRHPCGRPDGHPGACDHSGRIVASSYESCGETRGAFSVVAP